MKLALREEMSRGRTLAERLSWLDGLGFDGIELTTSVDLPPGELEKLFADSPIVAANVPGSGALLDPDPAERASAKELMRERLELAATLGAAGVLTVPQFGSAPRLPDLSPYRSAAELERELFAEQLEELAPAARNAGVPIFLEPLNRYEQHLVNRLEQGVEFAEQAGGGVGIMAEFFHLNIEEAEIAASMRAGGQDIVHFHVAASSPLQPGKRPMDLCPA